MAEKNVIPKASIESDSEKKLDRKGFISWLTIGWLAFAAATQAHSARTSTRLP